MSLRREYLLAPASMFSREIWVGREEGRLDQFLAREESRLTRSRIRSLIDGGHVLVNGSAAKASRKLRPGDRLLLTIPPPQPSELRAEDVPLTVVYQDQELLVVDKPAGLAVHPGPGHPSQTLVNGILAICPDLQAIGGTLRPGIVHRLDKDTSGLMIVAKNEMALLDLSTQFKDRQVRKGYLALAQGRLEPSEGTIDAPIGRHPVHRKRMGVVSGGRQARTAYRVVRYLSGASFLEVYPTTGRTHQIRVHLTSLGHPLVGDWVYGRKDAMLNRHFLHAHLLGFRHPTSGEPLEFTSPLPDDLQRALALADEGTPEDQRPSN